MCAGHLALPRLCDSLESEDVKVAEEVRKGPCQGCGRRMLHVSNYPRKPRGPKECEGWIKRYSFCCGGEDCRKRTTPPSVRFCGGRVYALLVVLLVAGGRENGWKIWMNMQSDSTMDRSTRKCWRKWWVDVVVRSALWRELQGDMMHNDPEALLVALWEHISSSQAALEAMLKRFAQFGNLPSKRAAEPP